MENLNTNEIKNEQNENLVITDTTEKTKERFVVRVKNKIVEYHDKDRHPIGARVVRGAEYVGCFILGAFATKAFINSEVEKGNIPVDLCDNDYYTGNESEVYEAESEDKTEMSSDESGEETKEEPAEVTAE